MIDKPIKIAPVDHIDGIYPWYIELPASNWNKNNP